MDDRIYRVFGSRVRELREAKGITQEELGRSIELSRTSITNIEKGRQRVMLHQMVEIADALDEDVSKLMPTGDDADEPQLRPDIVKAIEVLRKRADREA